MEFGERSNEQVRHELGQRIRAVRKSRGLNQTQLAERAGVSRPTVSKLERGTDVSLDSFLSSLRALDLLDALRNLVPEPGVSPMAELTGKVATKRSTAPDSPTWTWGDESALSLIHI